MTFRKISVPFPPHTGISRIFCQMESVPVLGIPSHSWVGVEVKITCTVHLLEFQFPFDVALSHAVLSVRFEVGVSFLLAPVGADKRGPKAPFPLVENA